MKFVNVLAAIGAIVFAGSVNAAALPYSSVIVFGDSLTDSGNARLGSILAGNPNPPANPLAGYFDGRFSNGYNFADYLSLAATGAPATPFLAGGHNFSVGGADAAGAPGAASPDFATQLGFFASTGQPIASDALVVVTFGGNDIRDVIFNTGPVDFTPTFAALQNGLAALTAAGARNILVTGLPDIGALPVTFTAAALAGNPDIIDVAHDRSLLLNTKFDFIATKARHTSGADIRFFDLLGFENDLLANPAAYGLPPALNAITPCQAGGPAAVLGGCEGYLYFDPIHPTTQVHLALATAIGSQLLAGVVPEPTNWAMMILGFGLVGCLASPRRRAQLGFA